MFYNCTNLLNTPELLATTLAACCYCSMSEYCTNLKNGPKVLPALILPDRYIEGEYYYGCYAPTSNGCTKLVKAPKILATAVGKYSCVCMFQECMYLDNAPKSHTAILADECYSCMFSRCSNLQTAPLIAGKIHKTLSYDNMFDDCTKLSYVKCLLENPDDMPSDSNWLQGVSASGTFVKKSSITWSKSGASGIPTSWTVEEADE